MTSLAGAPAERIVVELTEHAPVEDYEVLGEALAPLREAGARVAIDDVGSPDEPGSFIDDGRDPRRVHLDTRRAMELPSNG